MPDWICPDCGGGFPDYELETDTYGRPDGRVCPWCGRPIDGGGSNE